MSCQAIFSVSSLHKMSENNKKKKCFIPSSAEISTLHAKLYLSVYITVTCILIYLVSFIPAACSYCIACLS